MPDININIKLSKHAKIKMKERNISSDDVKDVILMPETTKSDKFDKSLVHFIGKRERKYLRVIGRWQSKRDLLVVSAFFDRRLARR